MPATPIYLNVPFAEKDAAKALGARWDAANKKWYIPAGKSPDLFTQWLSEDTSNSGKTTAKPTRTPAKNTGQTGVITIAEDKGFVAYNGDMPPWD